MIEKLKLPRALRRVESLSMQIIKVVSISPAVGGYSVGFTAQPLMKRGDQYRGEGYHDIVLLADKLTRAEGKLLEKALFERLQRQDRRSPMFRKFKHGDKKNRHYPSHGGASIDFENDRIAGVYMAWWRSEQAVEQCLTD
jgi:hypothetical protein